MAIGYLNKGGSTADLDAITATAPDVLKDKVILDKEGEPLKGTMPNNGSWSSSGLKAGSSISVPLGYHNGKGTITADTLANQTSANASAGQILRGQTAWVNGGLVTGTMNNYSGNTNTSNPVASTFRSATTGYVYASPGGNGYYTTGSYLRIPASNLSAANIKKGVNVMGIIGTAPTYVPDGQLMIFNGRFDPNNTGLLSRKGVTKISGYDVRVNSNNQIEATADQRNNSAKGRTSGTFPTVGYKTINFRAKNTINNYGQWSRIGISTDGNNFIAQVGLDGSVGSPTLFTINLSSYQYGNVYVLFETTFSKTVYGNPGLQILEIYLNT